MRIGAISFQPYVYHVNAISPASMNRLSRISDNVLDQKTDFSGLTKTENENPLRKGQTLNFQDMLKMQMQRGRSVAARMIKPADAAQETAKAAAQQTNTSQETEQKRGTAVTFGRENAANAVQAKPERDAASENAKNIQTAAFEGEDAGNGVGNYRMQQAIDAYQMFMTA